MNQEVPPLHGPGMFFQPHSHNWGLSPMAQSKEGVTPSFGGQSPPQLGGAELQALELRCVGAPSCHPARLSLMRERDHRSYSRATCFRRDNP